MRTNKWLIAAAIAGLWWIGCSGGSMRLSPSYVAVHNTMAAMGLAQSGEISEGALSEGEPVRITTHLLAGDCYTIVAFADESIANLDVELLDETGAQVATDSTMDSQAAVQVCPDMDADYQVALRSTQGSGTYVLSSWSGSPRGGAAGHAGAGRGTCSAPIALQLGQPVRGNTSQGQSSLEGSCVRGGDAPEIVYQVRIERRAQLSATIDSDYDGALYLLGDCNQARSEIACNDDAPTTSRSHIEATLDPGTYFLVVDGFGSGSGNYELLASLSELQELAQVCGGAQALRSGQAVTGSTAGQPGYFTATCAGGARSPDRVYSLDVQSRSRLRLRMQSTFDGALHLRSNCPDANSEIACNDDHRDTLHSMLVTTLDPGRYYVIADGFSDASMGDYSLRADLAPLSGAAAPADNCASAGTINPGQDVELDTFPASDDFHASCGGQGAADVVYRLDVQSRTRLRASLSDEEFPAALYIQTACGQQATEVACASGGAAAGGPTTLDTNLQPGTYFLVVDGAAQDAFGAARLEVQMDDLQALERACTQAPRLRPGRTLTGDTGSSSDRFQASCAGGAQSNDLIYRLVLTRRSRVRISSDQQYDGALYIRRDCTDMSTEVACNDDAQDNRHSLIETTLDAGTYYVFVDGFGDRSQGSFTLDVNVSRP